MKTPRSKVYLFQLFSIAVSQLFSSAATTTDVYVPVSEMTGTAATNCQVQITCLSLISSGLFVRPGPRLGITGTNGICWFSNLLYGNYQVAILGTNAPAPFRIVVSNAGPINAAAAVTTGVVAGSGAAYTSGAADARFCTSNQVWTIASLIGGPDSGVTWVQASNLATVINYYFGANATNFTYSIGANGTNFTYSLGANGTNFAYGITAAASNLAYAIGANGTNFTYGIGANTTNFAYAITAYAIGANGTNFTYGIGANTTNFAYAITAAASNLAYAIGANATNFVMAASNTLASAGGGAWALIATNALTDNLNTASNIAGGGFQVNSNRINSALTDASAFVPNDYSWGVAYDLNSTADGVSRMVFSALPGIQSGMNAGPDATNQALLYLEANPNYLTDTWDLMMASARGTVADVNWLHDNQPAITLNGVATNGAQTITGLKTIIMPGRIVITGAGNAGDNGLYVSSGSYFLKDANHRIVTNAAGAMLLDYNDGYYTNAGRTMVTWTIVSGPAPAPSGRYGTLTLDADPPGTNSPVRWSDIGAGLNAPTFSGLVSGTGGAMIYGDSNKTNGTYISNLGETLSNAVGRVDIEGGSVTMSGALRLTNTPTALALAINTNQLVVTNGSVGIGTASPQAKVHVLGTTVLDGRTVAESTALTVYSRTYNEGECYVFWGAGGTTATSVTAPYIGLNFVLQNTNPTPGNISAVSFITGGGNFDGHFGFKNVQHTPGAPIGDFFVATYNGNYTGKYPLYGHANGSVVINGTGSTANTSTLDVVGNVALGSYAGVNAAPVNGLIVSGSAGLGTTSPGAKLDVVGDIVCSNIISTNLVVAGTNLTMMTALAAPTVTGTNNGILWASNNTLFWTWTAGGTTTNTAKIQGP